MSKIQHYVWGALQTFHMSGHRFDYIHVDFVGPLPPFERFTHLFTVVDRFTRWPDMIPLLDMPPPLVQKHFSCTLDLLLFSASEFGAKPMGILDNSIANVSV